jgi:hypothetical protein
VICVETQRIAGDVVGGSDAAGGSRIGCVLGECKDGKHQGEQGRGRVSARRMDEFLPREFVNRQSIAIANRSTLDRYAIAAPTTCSP